MGPIDCTIEDGPSGDATHIEVQVRGGTAVALGTRFNVRLNAAQAEVSVLEGRVRVSADVGRRELVLNPGDVGLLEAGEAPDFVGNSALGRIEGWHKRKLDLSDVSLADAVADLNRYNTLKLRIGDKRLGEVRVTGVFRVDRPAEFADALTTLFGVRVVPQAGDLVLLPDKTTADGV
jgi:transmembrane sensor